MSRTMAQQADPRFGRRPPPPPPVPAGPVMTPSVMLSDKIGVVNRARARSALNRTDGDTAAAARLLVQAALGHGEEQKGAAGGAPASVGGTEGRRRGAWRPFGVRGASGVDGAAGPVARERRPDGLRLRELRPNSWLPSRTMATGGPPGESGCSAEAQYDALL